MPTTTLFASGSGTDRNITANTAPAVDQMFYVNDISLEKEIYIVIDAGREMDCSFGQTSVVDKTGYWGNAWEKNL